MPDSPSALSADQRRSLQSLAETMIPASVEYGVPSAGDKVIFADILRSFGRDAEHVAAVLRMLDSLSGGVFADLDPLRRDAMAAQLREVGGQSLMYLSQIILQCYYRDENQSYSWMAGSPPRCDSPTSRRLSPWTGKNGASH